LVSSLISDGYLDEQKLLHEQSAYGSRGYNWAYLVAGIAKVEGCASVLDYGCGKGTMGRTLRKSGVSVSDYDPAIKSASVPPAVAADLVTCVDVLEHIEPDCLDAVLNHIAACTRKILFVAISTRPAKRWLTDGRNTHLIVESGDWWRPKFEERGFTVRRVWETALPEWVAMMEKRGR
jgi:hypothetical protein